MALLWQQFLFLPFRPRVSYSFQDLATWLQGSGCLEDLEAALRSDDAGAKVHLGADDSDPPRDELAGGLARQSSEGFPALQGSAVKLLSC